MSLSSYQIYASVPPHEDEENGKESFVTDFIYLRPEHQEPWWRRIGDFRTISRLLGIACFVTLLIHVIVGFSRRTTVVVQDAECLHALGGGASSPGGGFDVALVKSAECKRILHAYLAPKGNYWTEVALAADSAIKYFKEAAVPVASNHTVVFDIDETVLSNIDEFLSKHQSGTLQGKPLQHNSPAIKPMLNVYQTLYASGYTVTFVTGRGESSREHTVANLAAAGYGSQCPTENGKPVRTDKPCWLQLDMRAPGDVRLASVYKPDKRGQLIARGFEIVGNFGDQFSDLCGENSAVASFKLPNPMYYIL